MQIVIERESGIPFSRQIREGILGLVRAGKLAKGDRLLPSRDMAKVLGVSRGTVVKAYEELESSGWVKTRVGRGTFVSGYNADGASEGVDPEVSSRPRGVPWDEVFSRYVTEGGAQVLQDLAELVHDPGAINFASGLPSEEEFPVDLFRRAVNHVLKRDGRSLLQFGQVTGIRAFREYLVRYLSKRGIVVSTDEIQVVNGIQQGLDLTARVLLEPGDSVILESPTYPGAISLMRSFQTRIFTVPIQQNQYPVDLLRSLITRHRPKLFYINPTFHNPTGLTLSRETRQILMDLVSQFNLVVVEDDCTGDLSFGDRSPVPLKALDRYNQVIFIGSFSKHLFPGLRLGWVVSEKKVIQNMALVKATTDLHTNSFNQGVMVEFCERGFFEDHLRKMRRLYSRNCSIMLRAMERHFPREVVWTNPEGGISLWVTMPSTIDSTELFFKARDRGIIFTPGKIFFSGNEGQNNIRLNFSRVKSSEIEEGIGILGRLMQELIEESRQNLGTRESGTTPLV